MRCGTLPSATLVLHLAVATMVAAPAMASSQSSDSIRAIAAGSRHTCTLTNTGAVWCWGHDIARYAGERDAGIIARPTRVSPAPAFVSITAFAEHMCGLSESGEAWCWGTNEWGQTGNGPGVADRGQALPRTDVRFNAQAAPFRVRGGSTFTQMSVGGSVSCGVTEGQAARCWGFSTFGALGAFDLSRPNYTGGDNPIPIAVEGDHRFRALYAGVSHTCALTPDGEAWCWGADTYGQTGRARANRKHIPGRVEGSQRFITLALGSVFSCGLGTDSAAYCWGTGGRRGRAQSWVLGSNSDSTVIPVRANISAPLASIVANANHACALTPEGEAWCWGANEYGQLGRGNRSRAEPPAAVHTSQRFRQLAVGAFHTCGLSTSGAVWCWGEDEFRQVGGGQPNCPGVDAADRNRCFVEPVLVSVAPRPSRR